MEYLEFVIIFIVIGVGLFKPIAELCFIVRKTFENFL